MKIYIKKQNVHDSTAVLHLSEDGEVAVKGEFPNENAELFGCFDGKIYAYSNISGKLIKFS